MIKFFLIFLSFSCNCDTFLVVPGFARHMLIASFACPLTLKDEAISDGVSVRIWYALPESTADSLKHQYFPGFWINNTEPPRNKVKFPVYPLSQYFNNHQFDNFPFPLAGRKKRSMMNDQFKGYKNKITEEDLKDTSDIRWLFYDGLAKILSVKRFGGRPCVLRAICEAAESKFGSHGGLFGELFHILFRQVLLNFLT
jgi:hypothetical protein